MSTLQYLREKAGPLVAIVIGVALVLFVVSDFFGKGRGQRRQQREYYEIGKIGKNTISYFDYETRVQDVIEIHRLSGNNVDEFTTEQIREQIWHQMIRETILDSKYEKLGISVSAEELDELVFGNNPHNIVRQLFTDQQTGFFNSSFMVNFLKQTEFDETAKRYWLFFENEIILDRLSSKFNSFVSKGLYVTSKQAEFEKALMANTVDFSYIMKNYSSVPDSEISITNNEVTAYFEKHKENYKRTAQRDIEYVIFEVTPSEDDIQETEKWITTTKEDFGHSTDPVQFINITSDVRHTDFFYSLNSVPDALKDFVRKEDLNSVFGPYLENGSYKIARLLAVEERPDSVRVRHILISPNQTGSLENTKILADSLAQVLRSNRNLFEEYAMMFSEDFGSSQIGGDLGWFSEGVMIAPFNNACFTSRRGEIKTVETNFGIHIIEVLDVSRRTKKYDIGYVERRIIASSQTNQRIYNEASLFAGSSNTYEKFNNAIAERQLNKRIANNIIPQQRTIPGIDNPRSLIMALFETKKDRIILDHNQQAIFELGDSYVIAYCTRVQEDGYAAVEDVDIEIRIALMKDKKAEIISNEFKSNMTAGRNLDAIASALNLYVQDASQVNFRSYTIEGAGIEPALAATAPQAALDAVSGPVKGENGVFLFSVYYSEPSAEENIDAIQQRLTSMAQFRGSYASYEALRRDAKIIDKRYKFY